MPSCWVYEWQHWHSSQQAPRCTANTVLLPVPWEVTVLYGAGTANGPEAILAASAQVDLFDPERTPVPGGMELEEALYLIRHAVRRGKQIIGFDLNEVACGADEWDANVGARLLYRMANLASASNNGSLRQSL